MAGTTRLSNTTLFRRNHVGNGLSSASVAGAAAAAFVVFGRRQAGRSCSLLPYPTRTDCLLLRFRTVVGVVAVGLILERGVARGERPLGASFLFTSAYRVVLQNASFFYELIGEL